MRFSQSDKQADSWYVARQFQLMGGKKHGAEEKMATPKAKEAREHPAEDRVDFNW